MKCDMEYENMIPNANKNSVTLLQAHDFKEGMKNGWWTGQSKWRSSERPEKKF